MTVSQSEVEGLTGYDAVVYSFGIGLHRLWGAEGAISRLYAAFLAYSIADAKGAITHPDDPYQECLNNLAKIPHSSYESAAYVTNVSHLVYATTLFDTFLTETTLFLFLLHPRSIGPSQQVPLQTVIASASVNDLITEAATKRGREVSYLSFPARLDFLRESFGLNVDLDDDAMGKIKRYASLRNSAIHDQGIFEIRLDEDRSVAWRTKTSVTHPTPVLGDDVHQAIGAYTRVFQDVASELFAKVLKRAPHPAVRYLLERGDDGPG